MRNRTIPSLRSPSSLPAPQINLKLLSASCVSHAFQQNRLPLSLKVREYPPVKPSCFSEPALPYSCHNSSPHSLCHLSWQAAQACFRGTLSTVFEESHCLLLPSVLAPYFLQLEVHHLSLGPFQRTVHRSNCSCMRNFIH